MSSYSQQRSVIHPFLSACSLLTLSSGKHPQAQVTPLTREHLQRVPSGYYTDETYLAQDENFERVPLGLQTSRKGGDAKVDDWEAWWRKASGGAK